MTIRYILRSCVAHDFRFGSASQLRFYKAALHAELVGNRGKCFQQSSILSQQPAAVLQLLLKQMRGMR